MKKTFFKVFTPFAVIIIVAVSFLSIQFYSFVQNPLPVANGYVLVIPAGTSVQKIAEQLVRDKMIPFAAPFLIWVRWQDAWGTLKAGEYLIKPGTTPTEFIHQLQSGRVIQHTLTIIPGWNFQQLIEAINQAPKLSHTFIGSNTEDIMTKIGRPGEHPEGRFYADTYYFPAGTSDIAFLKRAYAVMQEKLNAAWDQRAENIPLKTAYEALILASIIEKESSVFDEYTDIAGVYTRRLEKNMPLQADPTVIYGAGNAYTGPITKDLLQAVTPYNTYQITGLPPTPIAFPSQQALEAALHPKPGNSLYFVAKPNGKGHVFSNTLEEHQVAVSEYRKTETTIQTPTEAQPKIQSQVQPVTTAPSGNP